MKQHIHRTFWITSGFIALGLGVLGIPLPLLPTTPFLLLAAFCFSQSSETLHNWLVEHPKLGSPIKDWQRHGAISKKAKIAAGLAMIAAFAISVIFGAPLYALGLQLVVLSLTALFIFTRPLPPKTVINPHPTNSDPKN